jgi:hypothetical protein
MAEDHRVMIRLPQAKIDFADELACRADPIGHWSRQAWTEDSYCYRFATHRDANFFRWFCAGYRFWPAW